jgi:hypothetical protein
MGLISPTLPTVGSEGRGAGEVDVRNALTTILAEFNGNITDANIKSTAAIADSKLATPGNVAWRTVVQANFGATGGQTAATYLLTNGASLIASGVVGPAVIPAMWVDSGFALSGKAVNYRIAARCLANTVAPGVTLTAGLHPITGVTGSGSNQIGLTLSAAVGGTVALAPSAGGGASSEGSAISGLNGSLTYCLGMVLSGTIAATSYVVGTVALQMRYA